MSFARVTVSIGDLLRGALVFQPVRRRTPSTKSRSDQISFSSELDPHPVREHPVFDLFHLLVPGGMWLTLSFRPASRRTSGARPSRAGSGNCCCTQHRRRYIAPRIGVRGLAHGTPPRADRGGGKSRRIVI